ncbi:cytochrome c3 family protein [Shewanella halifaxensis]|uniref:cytochrome c3 family protein n=1 Tax=Shewanella halifaxensis TaxID=271098 RepID=UPI0013A65A9D|nr:cytochrome c3 family protein [Shewanella halifaxensis]
MMKRSLYWLSATALAYTLSGCGSDNNDNSTPPPIEPPSQQLPANVFGAPSEKEKQVYSNIRFAIAERAWTAEEKAARANMPQAKGAYDTTYGSLFEDDFKWIIEPMDINMKDVKLNALRDDVFVEGRGSFVDLLLYAGEKYGFDVETEWDAKLETHWVKSITKDGVKYDGLPEMLQPERYKNDDAGFKMLVGVDIWEIRPEKDEEGDVTGDAVDFIYKEEEIYHRADLFPVKNDMSVIFIQAQPAEMEIRANKYQTEMERFDKNGGKTIIPEIVIDFKPGQIIDGIFNKGVRAEFHNIEVKPYNLRTDLYKEGVITELDAWLSLQDAWKDKGLNIQWSYWPKLSTSANVQGYVATAIEFNGVDSNGTIINQRYTNNGACGFVHHTGERKHYNNTNKSHNLYNYVMCSNRVDMEFEGECYFRAKGYGFGEEYEDVVDGSNYAYMQGYTPFGGNDPHLTGDAMVLYNVEYINYLGAAFGSASYGTPAKSGCDVDAKDMIDLSNVIDISQAKEPLTDSHFGWQQPDCTSCHNVESGNGHILEDMTPWGCAECHGNNGAPDSHGEVMTCGFCHAKTLELHGDAYSNRKDYTGQYTNFKEPESCLTCHVDPALK